MKSMKKNKKGKNTSVINIAKLAVSSVLLVVVLAIVLLTFIKLRSNVVSVYNISDLERKIDLVQPGDTINYNLNGVNEWQVLRKDKYNGTIDVISKENVKDITLTEDNATSAKEIFSVETNKFKDNEYAIDSKLATRDDISLLAYQEDFWLSPKTNYIIDSSKGDINFNEYSNPKITVLPYIQISDNDAAQYNNGDTYSFSAYGIDTWYILEKFDYGCIYLVPSHPIEVEIDSIDENVEEKIRRIFSDIRQSNSRIYEIDYADYYDYSATYNLLKTMFSETEDTTFVLKKYTRYSKDEHHIYSNDEIFRFNVAKKDDYIIYRDPDYVKSETLGLRPVVTLKYGSGAEAKEPSSKLKIGDYVRYSAKGYNSWRVLSINEDEKTIDIISGGAVKNITFIGKNGYDSAIDELQNEASQYLDGDTAIRARVVEELDYNNLNKIKQNTGSLVSYWSGNKREYTNDNESYYQLAIYENGALSTGDSGNSSGNFKYINLYMFQRTYEKYKAIYRQDDEEYSYTAGLRPVITLKYDELDNIEKLTSLEIKELENSVEIYNKTIYNNQKSKNKEYVKIFTGNIENNYTSSSGEDDKKSYDDTKSTTKIYDTCCNERLLKVLIVIGIIIVLLLATQTVVSTFILKNMKTKNK